MSAPKWADYVWHSDNPFGYDAAYAVAVALDKAVPILKKRGKRLEDFTYDDDEIGRVIFELLNETKFTGVSVGKYIYFYRTSDISLLPWQRF